MRITVDEIYGRTKCCRPTLKELKIKRLYTFNSFGIGRLLTLYSVDFIYGYSYLIPSEF